MPSGTIRGGGRSPPPAGRPSPACGRVDGGRAGRRSPAPPQPRALRQRLVAQLEPEVTQVEEGAQRLVTSIGNWASGEPEMSAARLLERLKAVDAALADVAQAEATALGPAPASSVLPLPRPRARDTARPGTPGSGSGGD